MGALIQLNQLRKSFPAAAGCLPVLHDISLNIHRGDNCAILGESGSGKSTLLNMLGLLESVDEGEYLFCGQNVATMNNRQRARIRNQQIGFVFQHYNLLPQFSALENVALPLRYSHIPPAQAMRRAAAMLEQMGLSDRAHHHPAALSGGQKQRVAIARALINHPAVILADEPTGNLDGAMAQNIIDLLMRLNRTGVTLVTITHDPAVAGRFQRQLNLKQGVMHEAGAA